MLAPLGKSVSFLVRVLLILCVLSGGLGVVSASARASDSPTLLQFTSAGHVLGFSRDGLYAAGTSHALHVEFVGAKAVAPQADAAAVVQVGASPLRAVTYRGLWRGIDLTYRAASAGIYTSTYTLAPLANPRDIRLLYNSSPLLNADGTLSIDFETGALSESAPIAWQLIGGRRVPVQIAFRVHGRQVSFAVGAYETRYALNIDPTLTWDTFLGGTGDDYGYAIARDTKGNLYVAGSVSAAWGTPVRAYRKGVDAMVVKLSPAGARLWHTFLGGNGDDTARDIAVDGSGNAYVAGQSTSSWGTPVRHYTGGLDAFAAKVDSTGHLVWNTFLGDTLDDSGFGIARRGDGTLYVAGTASSAWGCAVDCTTRDYTASTDGFVAKLTSGGALLWNSFLGGSDGDNANALTVDSSGNVYATGDSKAAWSCAVDCTVRDFVTGRDGFAARLDASGNLTWNSFLGDAGTLDQGRGIARDAAGNIYVSGYSDATWGCVTDCTVRDFKDGLDGFVAKLSSAGSLVWNTFLGSNADETAYGIALDSGGNIYVVGETEATWGAPLRRYSGSRDGYAAKLGKSGALAALVFLGGADEDSAYDIVLDAYRKASISGASIGSWGHPVHPYAGGTDAFVAKTDFALYLNSTGSQDGWILESGELSNKGGSLNSSAVTLRLGDDPADKQYRSVLSFNTAALPDTAVIGSVTLKIKKAGIVGSSPFAVLGNLLADMRKGPLSGNKALQLTDFQTGTSKNAAFTITNHPTGAWYIKALPSGVLTLVNKAGLTQFRLRFAKDDNDDHSSDYITFYSGNAASANRPLLIITFTVP
jgi:hypothetical protein